MLLCIQAIFQSWLQVDAFSPIEKSRTARASSSSSPPRPTSYVYFPRRSLPGAGATTCQFHYDPSWLEGLGSGYTNCLENYYLPTQSATGALCASVGDVIAQCNEQKEKRRSSSTGVGGLLLLEGDDEDVDTGYNSARTFHYFLKGLGGGIMWAYWFDLSEPLSNSLTRSILVLGGGHSATSDELTVATTTTIEGTLMISVAWKEQATRTLLNILLEQCFISPVLFAVWDIPLPALLRGTPWRQLPTEVQTKLGPLLVANAKVWTLVNVVTYNIPVQYRVLFASCADIVWQSINASITSQEVRHPARSTTTTTAPAVLASTSPLLPTALSFSSSTASQRNNTTMVFSTTAQNDS
jgi:hypothetical protein